MGAVGDSWDLNIFRQAADGNTAISGKVHKMKALRANVGVRLSVYGPHAKQPTINGSNGQVSCAALRW